MLRILLISLLTAASLFAQRAQISIPTASPEEHRLKRYIDQQLMMLTAAIGEFTLDSVGGVMTTDTVYLADSLGDTVYFQSVDQWVVTVFYRAHWKGGEDFYYSANFSAGGKPISMHAFEVKRQKGEYWDTLNYIAVGYKRRR